MSETMTDTNAQIARLLLAQTYEERLVLAGDIHNSMADAIKQSLLDGAGPIEIQDVAKWFHQWAVYA